MTLQFIVDGLPKPKRRHGARALYNKVKAKWFASTHPDKRTEGEEAHIAQCAKEVWKRPPVRNPFIVNVKFYFEVPPSWPKWKREAALAGKYYHVVRPDEDNLRKAVPDACEGIIWVNDSQIIGGYQMKYYAVESRTEVYVEMLEQYERCPVTGK